MFFIYSHTNRLNGKRYVGFTSKSVATRFENHCAYAKAGSSTTFHKALRKYGKDVWDSEVLAEAQTENEAKVLEVKFIAEFESNKRGLGYNMTPGGDGNSNTGRKLAPAHAAKLALILRAARERTTPEQYAARGAARRGEVRTAVARAAISRGATAAKAGGLTPEQLGALALMHAKNRGKARSEETRRKISESNKGRAKKLKLSESQVVELVSSSLPRAALAEKFGVGVGTVTRYKQRFTGGAVFKAHVPTC